MIVRTCSHRREDGRPCGAAPLREGDYCLWHDPEHADEVAEARRLGGQRRRRERVVAGAFEFNGLASTADLRRLLEIAAIDLLGLENSIARSRAIASLVSAGARLLETGEFEQRLAALEGVLQQRPKPTNGRNG